MNTWISLKNYVNNLFDNSHMFEIIYLEFYHSIIHIANEERHVIIVIKSFIFINKKHIICIQMIFIHNWKKNKHQANPTCRLPWHSETRYVTNRNKRKIIESSEQCCNLHMAITINKLLQSGFSNSILASVDEISVNYRILYTS